MPKLAIRDQALPYQFQSLTELIRHFENRLSIQEIEKVILETGQFFVCRGAETGEQERLTFLKRCHTSLRGSLMIHEEQLVGSMSPSRA